MEKIGIIGSGTWGTVIAVLLVNNGHEGGTLVRDPGRDRGDGKDKDPQESSGCDTSGRTHLYCGS